MSDEKSMKRLLAALVVVSACAVAGVGIGAAATAPPTESVGQSTVVLGLFDGIQDFIEELDNFLESVADLMKTVNELFGGGEEGGD